ncbi:3-oxoacyl-[acyl-carrier-protein] synthase III C-terminal domain-containing protein [Legionella spiritensis]|uniref:Naringenin-chalcone synthase n=1 Tax=Legionella spiritensis TaxID=452 RepID=A0A0W0ZAV6_LEGSP|nr:3-oxoacyl-[acyl-carrier-protein] synthase III C-terminal domain-containing protein [Legionella spiritensis]KTD66290.1 Naringenin-chalcone synthase [Legionella spiritensis]SNV48499.1 Naringenin-chalcone synthase [Legionella spiritensis]
MAAVNIMSIASEVPDQRVLSEDIINAMEGKVSNGVADMMKNMDIRQRYSVVEDYSRYLSGKKERKLISNVNQLAVKSIHKCVNAVKEKLDISLFIAITNTALRPLPCMAYEIMSMIDETIIPRNTNVINMQNQGCSTMVKALEIAQNYLKLDENKQVMITIAETHTAMCPAILGNNVLSYAEIDELVNLDDKKEALLELNKLINGYLFGDGAITILLSNNNSKSTFICEHVTNLSPGDTDILYMNEGGSLIPSYSGFPHYYLSKSVPLRGIIYSKYLLKQILAGMPQEEFVKNLDLVFIHTGSKKIIDCILRALKFGGHEEKSAISYSVLEQYGNLSACSLAFMLEKAINDNQKLGKVLLASFGVGFSGSMASWSF